jgi:hypothetical protein
MRKNKPKFEKLEAGERKTVRQSGAMKTARTTGKKTNIYSGEKGGLMGYKANNEPKAILRNKKTVSAGDAKASVTALKTYGLNAGTYEKQSMINQKDFEKTRLGSRMVKKAEKAKEKGKFREGSEYTNAIPKKSETRKDQKKQVRQFGSTSSGSYIMSDLKPTMAQKKEAKRVEKQIKEVKKVKNKRGIN